MKPEQRLALIDLAMRANTDEEWGYDSDAALADLQALDRHYDWAPELLQAELESDRRTMGPPPPAPRGRAFLTSDWVVREALRTLESQLLFARDIHGPATGTTVEIRLPRRYQDPVQTLPSRTPPGCTEVE